MIQTAYFAAKVIKKKNDYAAGIKTKTSTNEIDILKNTDHQHIVNLHRVINSPKETVMILDLVEGGELFDDIISRTKYSEHAALTSFK